jgi:Ca2+/Na+ antiporter
MRVIFNYSMSVIYLVLGLFLLIIGWSRLNHLQNLGLGILLIVYGIFRAYRIYNSERVVKLESDENSNGNSVDSFK